MSDSEDNDDAAVMGLVAYGEVDDDDDEAPKKETKKVTASESKKVASKEAVAIAAPAATTSSEAQGAAKGLPAALLAKLKKRGIVSAVSADSNAASTPAEAPLPAGWRIVVEKGSSSK